MAVHPKGPVLSAGDMRRRTLAAMRRRARVEGRLRNLGALEFTHAFCRSEGAPVTEVLARAGQGGLPGARSAAIVRVRHKLWLLVCDTLGLSLMDMSRLFEVEHTTVMSALHDQRARTAAAASSVA